MPSPFPYSPVIRECSWNKTQIEKIKKITKGRNGNFEWFFHKNMKDAFNEDLLYIAHFVVLCPFLRRPQILLIFIRHLALIKSNLRKKKIAFSFE